MSINEMLKNEIDRLPETVLIEVFQYIQFLQFKKDKNILAKISQESSIASFQKIWDNEEDAVYDRL